jgi:hypothetical protein
VVGNLQGGWPLKWVADSQGSTYHPAVSDLQGGFCESSSLAGLCRALPTHPPPRKGLRLLAIKPARIAAAGDFVALLQLKILPPDSLRLFVLA